MRRGCGEVHQEQGHHHRPERRSVDAEDEGVVLGEEREAGEGGPDHPAEVELGRRERDGAEQVLAGTRSGTMAW